MKCPNSCGRPRWRATRSASRSPCRPRRPCRPSSSSWRKSPTSTFQRSHLATDLKALDCHNHVDVQCRIGSFSSGKEKAVARISYIKNNSPRVCSGTLMNVTGDVGYIPYFLTANHCVATDAVARTVEGPVVLPAVEVRRHPGEPRFDHFRWRRLADDARSSGCDPASLQAHAAGRAVVERLVRRCHSPSHPSIRNPSSGRGASRSTLREERSAMRIPKFALTLSGKSDALP